MSDGLSWYIIVLSVLNILAMWWLIWWSGKGGAEKHAQGEEMSHTWDGDLKEFNNPLPRWWLWMFYLTIVFAFVYLALYPGLGKMKGAFAWTQEKAWEEEMAAADAKYGPIFAKYASMDLEALAADPEGRKIGQRLYLNYCATCHGSDAGGSRGFPNLADDDSLYGNDPAAIEQSILHGRQGVMPGFGPALGDQGVEEVAAYVLSLSGRNADEAKAAAGKSKFAMCAGCHGADGGGNTMLGAPNLADDTWLYGRSAGAVEKVIAEGVAGEMPAHADFLGKEKVRVVAGYVLSLVGTQ